MPRRKSNRLFEKVLPLPSNQYFSIVKLSVEREGLEILRRHLFQEVVPSGRFFLESMHIRLEAVIVLQVLTLLTPSSGRVFPEDVAAVFDKLMFFFYRVWEVSASRSRLSLGSSL